MASKKNRGPDRNKKSKVGSDPNAAENFAEKHDFGIPSEDAAPDMTAEDRDFPGRPAGNKKTRSGASGKRTIGVGSTEGPDGKGSGGDVDSDIIGLDGSGGSVASDGKLREPPGPDDSDGSSNECASGPPAKGEHRARYTPGQEVGDVTQREEGPENQNPT
ncbi:MAG TPA: hypothetical protein VGP94_10660 [Tepidisphaeraceae bacterium]|nr:hypothetical protein [Tepidisphaeraceae bacterium]